MSGRRKKEEGRGKKEEGKNYPYIAGVLLLSLVISPKFSYCNEQ